MRVIHPHIHPHIPKHVPNPKKGWVVFKRVIRQNPRKLFLFHAVSHFSYLSLVVYHGQGLYALAAAPAALAVALSLISCTKEAENERK